jgi:hypothetical protein
VSELSVVDGHEADAPAAEQRQRVDVVVLQDRPQVEMGRAGRDVAERLAGLDSWPAATVRGSSTP